MSEQELRALVRRLARFLKHEHEGHCGPMHDQKGHCEMCDAILEAQRLDKRRKPPKELDIHRGLAEHGIV